MISVLIFVILILGIVIYTLLQQWYKNRYEDYLFNGRNNMFNLISFIQNEKTDGKTDSEIERGLSKAGWNGEQITYVMHKFYGKRTGMFELIPVDKIKALFKGNPTTNQKVVFSPTPRRI
jgi:hypothetical protein